MKKLAALLLVCSTTLALASELHEGSPAVTVQMTAATLAGDCGGGGPYVPTRTIEQKSEKKKKSDSSFAPDMKKSKAKLRCEQTSMQLSVVSPAGATRADLRVKKVELFDETGKLVSELSPREPRVWSESAYTPWNESIAPAQSLSVSYALSQPDWSKVSDRWNKTFVVKAQITVGGTEQTVQRDVQVRAETSLPPGVKT